MGNEDVVRSLIDHGADLAGEGMGAATGAVVGTVVAGPAGAAGGAIVGAAVSKVAKRVLTDIVERTLSNRERDRVSIAAYRAVTRIDERLDAGDQLREDGFFDRTETERSSGEEVFEGALLKCKNEHEERKTEYISNIFANACFRPDVSAASANFVLAIGERLTYQQICLLALVGRQDEIDADLTEYWRGGWEVATSSNYQVLRQQLLELGTSGYHLQSFSGAGNVMVQPYLTPLGRNVFDLMGLAELPEAELRQTLGALEEFDPTDFVL